MSTSPLEAKSFFASLFDFQISSFITLRFLRVIYTLLVVLTLLLGAVFFLTFLFRGGVTILFALVVVPLVTLFYLLLARIYVELVAMFFRIGENTALIAERLGAAAASAGPPVPPTAGPDYGYPTGG